MHKTPWYFKVKNLSLGLAVLFLALIGIVFRTSPAEVLWTRIFGVGIIFLLLSLALLDHITEISRKERAWQKLAEQTGLTCQIFGSPLTGFSVQVAGLYKERAVTLSTFKQGKGQIPSTRIELQVDNRANATLRLRGPFLPKETTTDPVASGLFEASDARQFGDSQRFFIRSRPVHLVTNLFTTPALRPQLARLERLINIELEGPVLHFDELGVVGDVAYLQRLFDLLSDIADIVERGSHVKFGSLPPTVTPSP